jgi:hypothetical protein
MRNWLNMKTVLTLSVGLAMGLFVGVGMMVGALVATSFHAQPQFILPETALHASATHGSETLAIATGSIDGETDGVYTLDFLTGQLQCLVMNPRTGTFLGKFDYNVLGDLGVEKGKKPSFVMATGQYLAIGTTGNIRPAATMLYVVDANSGNGAAYSIPWNNSIASAGGAQTSPMIRMGLFKARNLAIRSP